MHFSSEERLLEQQGFPGVAEHRDAHQRLLVRSRKPRCTLNTTTTCICGSCSCFCATGMMHIEDLDHQYGTWLNERGIV